jgi:hypothetical protein
MEGNHPIKNRYKSQQTPHPRYTQARLSGHPVIPATQKAENGGSISTDVSLAKKLPGTHLNK